MDVDLAEVSIYGRYLYENLWCHMDRNGLCDANSKLIKTQVFPYDDEITVKKVTSFLEELVAHRFLIVVEWESKKYFYCPTLLKHQKFHPKEQPRHSIPAEHLQASCKQPAKQLLDNEQPPASSVGNGDWDGELGLELRTSAAPKITSADFESCWKDYPRKVEKSGAQKRFLQVIKTREDLEQLVKAIETYRTYVEDHRMPEPGIKHMATFLENRDSKPYFQPWKDWIRKPESPEKAMNGPPKPILPTGPLSQSEIERTRQQLADIEKTPPANRDAVLGMIRQITKGV